MSTWSCMYCTLVNEPISPYCNGCGSQKPSADGASNKKSTVTSFVPKVISDTVRDVSNAVSELITGRDRKPAHNFVRIYDFRTPLPNGPYVNGQSNDPRASTSNSNSSSTFFVETPQLSRYQNVSDSTLAEPQNETEPEEHEQMSSRNTWKVKEAAQKKSDVIYDDIVKMCTTYKTPFIDDEFRHESTSIGTLHFTKNGTKRVEQPDFLHWLRPSQMFTKDGRAFRWTVMNSPRPSDIEQGTLVGDCWLMSAMAVIAERPEVLDEIVPRKEYSSCGVYQIKVCVEGEWKVIIVDDFFPCYRANNSMAMAVGRRNQLWVPLIEKALAKVLGSYSRLHGASLTQGLTMLTGAACVNYTVPGGAEEVNTFWAQLVSSKESGFLMCCHCGAFEDAVAENEFRAMGLLTNHAYSILDVVDERQGPRLLRIRNPWGQFVWNGRWSDGWTGWPADMRRRLVDGRRDETGAFWIELDDFVHRFASVTVCKLRPDWSELQMKQRVGERNQKTTRLIVTEKSCEISLMAFQTSKDHDELNDLMICVHKIDPDGGIGELKAVSTRIADNHFATDEFFLERGEYKIVCHSLKSYQTHRDGKINIVVHSSTPIFAESVRFSIDEAMSALKQLVIKEGDIVKSTEDGVVIRTLTRRFRGMIIMADNCQEDKYLHVGVDCSDSFNIQSSRGRLQVTDVIPPLSRQVIIVLSTIIDTAQYRVSNSLRTLVHRHKYLLPQMSYEASIVNPKSQHYPPINPTETPIHNVTNVFF